MGGQRHRGQWSCLIADNEHQNAAGLQQCRIEHVATRRRTVQFTVATDRAVWLLQTFVQLRQVVGDALHFQMRDGIMLSPLSAQHATATQVNVAQIETITVRANGIVECWVDGAAAGEHRIIGVAQLFVIFVCHTVQTVERAILNVCG